MTGTTGTDASFRSVLAQPEYARDSLIACAFPSRARRLGTRSLAAVTVVPHGLTAGQALARRTVWMVRRASFLVLFPEHPHTGRWGPGSTLAFRTAAHNLTPTFVAASAAPPDSLLYRIVPSQLFATVTGFWTVPHPVFTEVAVMKYERRPRISITAAGDSPGRYLATFHAAFLDATYALSFSASVTGAVALHRFACMIEGRYGGTVDIHIGDPPAGAETTLVAQMLSRIRDTEPALR